ncbi:MAG: SEC-C metal-binding domain-containing protein [Erysipelotrichaceae bacterium]|nr:SEC-C metal-binding domain-containing protein [Erysipelotrichaceae bacterium]
MGKKKYKKQKPVKTDEYYTDEYYNDGLFELARYGKVVSMRNLSTPEPHTQMLAFYKEEYPKVKKRIDEKIQKIINEISICNPLMLLKFTKDMAMLSHMNKFSEIDYSNEENVVIRAQEYIQSILVSTENHFDNTEAKEEQGKRWHSVLADVEDLYKEFLYFYHYWSAYKKDTGVISDEMMQYIVESQMLYLVRGNRYQFFVLKPLKNLLPTHNDILVELFGVTADQVIEGLVKLEYSMSQGLADAWMDMGEKYDEFCGMIDLGADSEAAIEDARDFMNPIVEKIFGEDLNDISRVTGWDTRLIDVLSLGVGECNSFINGSEFSGWPIMELPTKKKSFIKIDGIAYAFDYYSLFDNIYRALQKEIFRLKPEYVDTWSKRQNLASENMVKDRFLKLLPGAIAYNGNYYPVGQSLKLMNENDLLIIYENYLFIIEVKAGSFPQTPPINDFDAHIKAYTKLAQEADSQCSRTIKYIEGHQPAQFYDVAKQKKFEINSFTEFKEIYSFSVTVDNFNNFAAKAEKLNFITLSSKTIVISYDDLLAYENYFDSPIYFLHFLKQRKLAIDIPQIALNDELDHLGMYISHNMYSITATEYPADHRVYWHGYRQCLDQYFCSLYHPEINSTKPEQDIPLEITKIIQFLEQGIEKNKIDVAHFLMNMSSEAKEEFCKTIHHVLLRQLEIGRMLVTSAFGEIKYCIFVSIPGIKILDLAERQDYVYSAILSDESMPIMWINLDYDKDSNLIDVKGKLCRLCDIPANNIERLKELRDEHAKSRIISFQRQNHRKVGRNDLCPCGSGKKFKKCCITI